MDYSGVVAIQGASLNWERIAIMFAGAYIAIGGIAIACMGIALAYQGWKGFP